TGVPSISIPIGTISDGPLSVPISLNYHAGGNKLGDIASWVGLGWSLDAGGMISRSVVGYEDDKAQNKGYIANEYNINSHPEILSFLFSNNYDTEADIYSLTAAGISCKF